VKPVILDLFCGAGGAAAGYAQAGFNVVGVDIARQPHYPFPFCRAEVIDYLHLMKGQMHRYQAIHASPPCQRYSAMTRRWSDATHHPDLIDAVRDLLVETGLPYVIENVMPAPLKAPVRLCGTMFGLGVFRHRLFETNWTLSAPVHRPHQGRVGDGRYFTVTGHTGGRSTRDGWVGGSREQWDKAMGIDWMTIREITQAIPPAYTRYVGTALLGQLRAAA
jgi:DNA (cytosine-5)-methyltransferase 1